MEYKIQAIRLAKEIGGAKAGHRFRLVYTTDSHESGGSHADNCGR